MGMKDRSQYALPEELAQARRLAGYAASASEHAAAMFRSYIANLEDQLAPRVQ
jgi:hypothetical protein